MAKTKGMTALIEDWLVTTLTALTDNESVEVFRTVKPYYGQLNEKGLEGFLGKSPFAYISYFPANPEYEGDGDLNDKLRFSILIGIESKEDGIAKRGDDTHLGASRIRDLIIAAIDKQHPGAGFECDELRFNGETEWADTPKKYATELFFVCNWVR